MKMVATISELDFIRDHVAINAINRVAGKYHRSVIIAFAKGHRLLRRQVRQAIHYLIDCAIP